MERFEMYEKVNGRYYFMGWYPMEDENRCINTKTRVINNHTHLYKTYKFNDNTIRELKYIID
ncbi:MAG: hypothetical protein IKL65_00485 [Bacilli bacterium]|nr:hypothetical protein [Bacilli bacterium]MBR6689793.1 hypothetical protein [Bacilli bacterium]